MDWMFIVGLLALIVAVIATSLFFYARPAKDEDGRRRMSRDDEGFLAFLAVCEWLGGIVGVIFMALASFSIMQDRATFMIGEIHLLEYRKKGLNVTNLRHAKVRDRVMAEITKFIEELEG